MGSIAKSLASSEERADGLRTVDLRALASWLDFQNTRPHVGSLRKSLFPLSAAVRVSRFAISVRQTGWGGAPTNAADERIDIQINLWSLPGPGPQPGTSPLGSCRWDICRRDICQPAPARRRPAEAAGGRQQLRFRRMQRSDAQDHKFQHLKHPP